MTTPPKQDTSSGPIDPAFAARIDEMSGSERQAAITKLIDMAAEKETLLILNAELTKTLDLTSLIKQAVFTISSLLGADRASLFLVDAERGELWSKVAQGLGDIEIRIPITSGIAGRVARTGEVVNLKDAYDSPEFNRETDSRTGYRTTSMLA